jgi:hypothetical protein
MAEGGRFRATDLLFSLEPGYLVVGCNSTGKVDLAGDRCGQNTAKEFALSVTSSNRRQLIDAMQEAIRQLERAREDSKETDSSDS